MLVLPRAVARLHVDRRASGRPSTAFGWEMLLLEAGFLAAFLGSDAQPPPTVVIVLFWWLVFRLEFGAGMIKIRGGREWRDLTALTYHHETQPMPGPLSRQAHLLPRWFHQGEVRRQSLRAAGRALVPVRAAPRALGAGPGARRSSARSRRRSSSRRSCGSSSPATSRGSTGRRSCSRSRRSGCPGIGAAPPPRHRRPALADRRHPAAVAHRDGAVGVLYVVLSWPAAAQPRSPTDSS